VRAAQLLAIAGIALPALAFVLWPLVRGGRKPAGILPIPVDEGRLELEEEKTGIYRALREIDFDHEAGHLSDDDYRELRDRYEARAAEILSILDRLKPRPETAPMPHRAESEPGPARQGWTRSPVALAVGATLLLVFGLVIGLNIGRFTEPDRTVTPPGSRLPVPVSPGAGAIAGGATASEEGGSARPIPPEMLAGMLRAARQSLSDGRYQEAIAAYQAVLKRDAGNVDAMTHLGLIVGIGGHADTALETFGRALAIDPNYAPAHLYRGQVLYEVKQDYPGAIEAWERFLALAPQGEHHDQVAALVKEAKSRQSPSAR
jgi:tetratricopeptide (TPR) repeat protein